MDSLRRRASGMVSSLLSSSSSRSEVRSDSPTLRQRQNWMPDAVSLECYECGSKFTAFRRRHHCRVCGQIFCYKCCGIYINGNEIGCCNDNLVRVCAFCFDFVQRHLRPSANAAEPPMPPPMPMARPAGHAAVLFSSTSVQAVLYNEGNADDHVERVLDPNDRRRSSTLLKSAHGSPPSVFDTVVNHAVNLTELGCSDNDEDDNNNHDNNERKKLEMQPDELLFALAEHLLTKPHSLIKGNQQSCFCGKDLLQWVREKGRRVSEGVFDPLRTCQRLLDHSVIEAVLGHSESFYADEVSLYRLARDNQRVLTRRSRSGSLSSASTQGKNRLLSVVDEESNVPDWMRRLEVSYLDDDNDLNKSDSTLELAEEAILATSPLSRAVLELPSQSTNVALLADEKRRSLSTTYLHHSEQVLRILCRRMTLEEELWHELIMKLCAKVVANLFTDYRSSGDDLDARNYVKVKLIPGGNRDESCFVAGEAFTNFVTRKGMSVRLERPRVLLISGSISFHRNEDKYVNLANLHLQEEEYVRNVCDSIISAKPDLILVEQSVCRPAQERIFSEGIALVLNVKPRVLERLSRIFAIPIISSLGSMVRGPQFGYCGLFQAQVFGDSSKQIVKLEHSATARANEGCNGCVLLIRGASHSVLKRVKQVIRNLLLICFHAKYEQAFLEAEFASIKSGDTNEIGGNIIENTYDFNSKESINHGLSPFIDIGNINWVDPENASGIGTNDEDLSEEEGFDKNHKLTRNQASPNKHPLVSTVLKSGGSDASVRDMHVSFRAHVMRSNVNPPKRMTNRIGLGGKRSTCTSLSDRGRLSLMKDEPLLRNCSSLPVLFSSFSPTSKAGPGYCIQPWIVRMQCYGLNDLPLGAFLETFCFSDTYACPNKACDTPMKEHVRRFCHDSTVATMIVRTLTNAGDDDQAGVALLPGGRVSSDEDSASSSSPPDLLSWKYCSTCQVATPIAALGPDAWTLSFASFLLLLFYERRLCHSSHTCPHSLHGHHVTYFAKGNAVTTFIVDKLAFYALLPPSVTLTVPITPSEDQKMNLEADVKLINIHGPKLFSVIQEALMSRDRRPPLSNMQPMTGVQEESQSLIIIDDDLMNEYQTDFDAFKNALKKLNVLLFDSTLTRSTSPEESVAKSKANVDNPKDNGGNEPTLSLMECEERVFGAKRMLSHSLDKWRDKLINLNTNPNSKKISIKNEAGSKKKNELGRTQSLSDGNGLTTGTEGTNKKKMELPNFESLLASPFGKQTHLNLGEKQRVVVDELQPSSIIAHALLSEEHGGYIRTESFTDDFDTDSSTVHFDYQFQDESCQFYCRALFARDFHALRQRVFGSESSPSFALSLSKSFAWQASGGKSGLLFYKTLDERFILKQMSKFETTSFQNFAPHYFQFVNKTLTEGSSSSSSTDVSTSESLSRTSLLAKILGVYWIGFKNLSTNNSLKLNLFVMENLHYGRNIVQSYDLKGSMRNRHVSQQSSGNENNGNVVLQDENLLRESCERPWYVHLHSKQLLLDAIHRDTSFLADNHMMDYSLLVGITEKRDELIIGIIDYLRTFTWDKKLETLVKSMGSKTPTVIEPQLYKRRFTEAMYRNFALVPDNHFKEGLNHSL